MGSGPLRAFVFTIALAFTLAGWANDSDAQRKRRKRKPKPKPSPAAKSDKPKKPAKPPKLDFSGMNLEGRLRTPQLLYFLERASAELQAASLERRSFVPEMVRSLDEEAL